MAPGVCVTSFRMFLRRSDFGQLSRGLRLRPVVHQPTLTVNSSWNLRGRGYCSEKLTYIEDSNSGKTNTEKAASSSAAQHKTEGSARMSGAKNEKLPHKVSLSNEINLKDIDLSQMKVAQLKALLRAHSLSASGTKPILIDRLRNYLQQQKDDELQQQQLRYPQNGSPEELSPSEEVRPSSAATIKSTTTTQLPQQQPQPQQQEQPSKLPQATLTLDLLNWPPSKDSVAPVGGNHNHHSLINHQHHSTLQAAEFVDSKDVRGDVSVEYIQGLPHLTVPLPSRNEKCRFALKPVSHKVGDLIEMLKAEDRGIDRATVLNKGGVRIASTCNIESLMDEPFWLHINDQKYEVVPPTRERIGTEDLHKLGDIRALVAQLYEALHVGEYHIQKEQELTTKLEDLKYQVTPMERLKTELSMQADRKISIMTWVGLGLMSVQFGILARLTWWEYSWDIMEPVTYFVTYGTAMAMYAYYCITKTEYNFPEVKNRQYLLTIHKRAKKKNFDVEEYNVLKRQIAELEYDLRRLRDPLNLQLPPHVDRAQQGPPSASTGTNITTTPTPSALTSKIISGSKTSSGFKVPFLEQKN